MKITIKYGNKSISKEYDINKPRDDYAFGFDLLCGINALKNYTINDNVYFEFEHYNQKYEGLCYRKAVFLSKAMKALAANKRCSCSRLIYCTCHDKCTFCAKCVNGTKTYSVVEGLGNLVISIAKKFNKQYDDFNENRDRDEVYD